MVHRGQARGPCSAWRAQYGGPCSPGPCSPSPCFAQPAHDVSQPCVGWHSIHKGCMGVKQWPPSEGMARLNMDITEGMARLRGSQQGHAWAMPGPCQGHARARRLVLPASYSARCCFKAAWIACFVPNCSCATSCRTAQHGAQGMGDRAWGTGHGGRGMGHLDCRELE